MYAFELDPAREAISLRIAELLQSLPRRTGSSIDISWIVEEARSIALYFDPDKHLRTKPKGSGGRETVRKELVEFSSHASALESLYNNAHGWTMMALNGTRIDPSELQRALHLITEVAGDLSHVSIEHVPLQMGPAKRSVTANIVTQYCCSSYYLITGENPAITVPVTRGHKARGPFLKFLQAVFEIMSIDAKAESQAKEAFRNPSIKRLKEAVSKTTAK